ncbi:aldose epimerase family protein [Streptomyces lydicus]|uniref:aldose epimerase family protein n=1 Tax=Streptomyces lydicus TaxID=47763 RepID=UPI0005275818|nr:aldose epimerase family protein [Streptomyces lydicus]MDC7339170.1 galactose mutarotase [Streptomyces lydicus]UEG91322.1 galactose mutarotase [Streptomyces lydicus]
METQVSREFFGTLDDGSRVDRWTLETGPGPGALRVRVLTYGGIVQSVEAPDRDGRPAQLALGFGEPASYAAHGGSHFGALVGRYANRIAGAAFTLDGRTYELTPNDGAHSLHGGPRNFSRVVWDARPVAGGVELHRVSPDGEEGFPGNLDVRVTYTLSDRPGGGALRIAYRARTDAPTVVNLTNHTYLNLGGDGSGSATGHELRLAAARYTPVDGTGIPLPGGPAEVAGTRFDFRTARPVGDAYDHNFALDGGVTEEPRVVAELFDPRSGRVLELATTEPGLQLYTAGHLDGSLTGTSGVPYGPAAGLALETQHFPDSPNRPEFPGTVLRPGETYRSTTVYGFGVRTRSAGGY